MNRRRTQLLFLFFSFFSLFFLGCSSPQNQGPKKAEITVWHWMTDRGPAFEELAKRYETKTGVKVNFELYAPSDAYSQKVRAAAQGRTLPDIYGILGEKRVFASFIKAGLVLNLEPYMQEFSGAWKNSFYANALAGNEFEAGNTYGAAAGIYGVPLDIMTIQMVYNKKLMRQLGLDPDKPPATLQEYCAIGPKIKQAHLQGLVSGWSELWMIDCFANNLAFNIMGKDKVLATIRGEVKYTDPDWIRVFDVFKQLKDAGILEAGVVTMLNKSAEQLFSREKALFAFNGSWCVNVYRSMNPGLDYGVMLPPKLVETSPASVWGGAGSSFKVNAQSPIKEEAVKFLRWLTLTDQQAYFAEATNNLPANKYSAEKASALLGKFADGMMVATHPNVWGVSEFPLVTEAIGKGIQAIIIGEKTPEQVALEAQKIKERQLAKKK